MKQKCPIGQLPAYRNAGLGIWRQYAGEEIETDFVSGCGANFHFSGPQGLHSAGITPGPAADRKAGHL
jgi:hypothetical protein